MLLMAYALYSFYVDTNMMITLPFAFYGVFRFVQLVYLKNFGGEGAAQYNLLMAGTMFSIVPIIVIYLSLNRFFIAGMTQGALKG